MLLRSGGTTPPLTAMLRPGAGDWAFRSLVSALASCRVCTTHGCVRSLPVAAFAVYTGLMGPRVVKITNPKKVCIKPNIRARPDALAHCLTSSSKIPLNSTRPFELYSMPLPFLLSSFQEPTYLLPSAKNIVPCPSKFPFLKEPSYLCPDEK